MDGDLTAATESDAEYLRQLARLRDVREHDEGGSRDGSRPVCDGVVPTALVDGLRNRCLPETDRDQKGHRWRSRTDAVAGAARVVAGRMYDVTCTVETARATQVACLLERLGAPVGTLGTAYSAAPGLVRCMACSEQVSKRWHVRYQGS